MRMPVSVIAFMLGCGVLLWAQASFCEEKDATLKSEIHPFDVLPFKIPAEFSVELKNYRNKWVRLTGFEFSGLHWSQFVIIFVNKGDDIYKKNYLAYINNYVGEDDEDEELEEVSFLEYAPGTIFLKENYLPDSGHPTHAVSLTLMVKREPGFDKGNGDWEYIQSNVQGEIFLRGKLGDKKIYAACAACHENMAERDYIFSTFYSDSQ